MPTKSLDTPIVPKDYAGQWIAWNPEQTKIVASGRTFREAWEAARLAGESNALLDKVPRADVRFIGGLRT
jgi:hypothetical protein